MAYPALASVEDVELRLGRDVDDPLQVGALLEDASAIVRSFCGATWVDDDNQLVDVPDGVSGVVARMVVRAIQNPDGTVQESTGPFSRSYGPAAADLLYLTKADKAVLAGPSPTGGLWTLGTTRDPDGVGLDTPSVTDEWPAREAEPTLPAGWP